MKLSDLKAHFLRYEERTETWKRVVDHAKWDATGRGDEGTEEVTGTKQHMITVDSIDEAQGVIFLCPKCYSDNEGSVGTHAVICWSRSRGVPEHAVPGPGRWKLVGTSLGDLTLDGDAPGGGGARSVLLSGPGCGWHGFVTNGDVI